jgi:hypothetical protein
MTDWKQGIPSNRRAVLAVTLIEVVGSLKQRRTIVRSQYIRHKEEESEAWDDNSSIDYYDEKDDCYYIKEGWYELIDCWDDYGYVKIDGPVIAWCVMPELPENQDD